MSMPPNSSKLSCLETVPGGAFFKRPCELRRVDVARPFCSWSRISSTFSAVSWTQALVELPDMAVDSKTQPERLLSPSSHSCEAHIRNAVGMHPAVTKSSKIDSGLNQSGARFSPVQ